jgi:hypothetical protein
MKKLTINGVEVEIADHYDTTFFENLFKDIVFHGNAYAPINNCIYLAEAIKDPSLAALFDLLKTYLYQSEVVRKRDQIRKWEEFDPRKHEDYKKLRNQLKSVLEDKNFPDVIAMIISEVI